MVLTLWQASGSPGGLVKAQTAGWQPQGFWLKRSRLGPENFISDRFPGDGDAGADAASVYMGITP